MFPLVFTITAPAFAESTKYQPEIVMLELELVIVVPSAPKTIGSDDVAFARSIPVPRLTLMSPLFAKK